MFSITLLAASLVCATVAQSNATIPDYVLSYAPLIYLDINEQYYPSDIGAQITNTYPTINFSVITRGPSALGLADLTALNPYGNCTNFADCNDLYLTSKDEITVTPTEQWLQGVLPNPITGETENATSCAVIVTDHGNGTIDAFFMFFYAFNYGIPVGSPNGTIYDDHVGDWEHIMVRFVNEQPKVVYYSVHNGGIAYTYDAVLKHGTRPLGFASKGGHATYAQEGQHTMYGGLANDSTSRGPLWDVIAGSGAWFYTFTPNNTDGTDGVFEAVNVQNRTSRGVGPTDWLHYYGRWGDKQYNSSYPGQSCIGSIACVFEDGPTGPLDKGLYRVGACPDNADGCSTLSSVEAASGTSISQTVSRTYVSVTTTSAGTSRAGTGSSTLSVTSTTSSGLAAATGSGDSSKLANVAAIMAAIGFFL